MKKLLNFTHGGDITTFAKSLKIEKRDVIDLSSNINFLKPKIEIDFNRISISSYPNYDKLYKRVAKYYRVKKEEIEFFNGGSVAIFSLFNYFNKERVIIYSPAYLEYKRASSLFGYKIKKINRFKNINKKIEKNSLIIFVNPSTPDGKYYNIEKFLPIWKKRRATILIDESFLDFTDKKSAIEYLKEYKNLYILKSQTKFYSSASVRLGVVISNRENIKRLREREALWKISKFDSLYLQSALKDRKFQKKTKKIIKKNRKYLEEILKNSSLFSKIYKSEVNFILAKLKKIGAEELQNYLKKDKILIRDCSNFDFLDNSFVRFAVKNKKSLKRLKKGLKKIECRLN